MGMATPVYVAGIGNSGPEHWQFLWYDCEPGGVWVQHGSWDAPVRDVWVRELDAALRAVAGPKLLVAHSLGGTLVVEWATRQLGVPGGVPGNGPEAADVVGAFLVALPDVHGPNFPAEAVGFETVEYRKLPFPTVVVASADDPYGTLDHSVAAARALCADLVHVGAKGHVNAASRLGVWPEGQALLRASFGDVIHGTDSA